MKCILHLDLSARAVKRPLIESLPHSADYEFGSRVAHRKEFLTNKLIWQHEKATKSKRQRG